MSAEIPEATFGFPRSCLPLFSIYEDSVVTGRGIGAGKVYETYKDGRRTEDTVIDKFWNNSANKDVVDAFMNNKLCVDAAQGKPEAIEAYKKYAVQDYFYLVDWFKFRVLRLATLPHDDLELDDLKEELNSVHRSLGSHVEGWYKTCTKAEDEGGLGIKPEDFQVERTIGAIAYGQYLLNNSRSDNWYNLHIILIGCYWGWSKLALKLYNDPKTDKSTIFYKSWILGSIDTSVNPPQMTRSAKALSSFLDQNQEIWSSQVSDAQEQELFRTVLRLEVGLFNSAYDEPIKRKPVPIGMPDGLPPLPGHRHGHGVNKEREWRTLLGLGSKRDNADEDGGRTGKM